MELLGPSYCVLTRQAGLLWLFIVRFVARNRNFQIDFQAMSDHKPQEIFSKESHHAQPIAQPTQDLRSLDLQ